MLARQEGLTKTYNRFHDPAEHSADIAELRRLHVEMDRAVLAAYGWSEVNLDHDFRLNDEIVSGNALTAKECKDARYALSEGVKEELLRRLLELNFQIAAEEEASNAGGRRQDREKEGRREREKEEEWRG